MAGGGKEGVDSIAVGALEVIAIEKTITFHVTDHRLDRVAPFEFALDGRGMAAHQSQKPLTARP